MEPPFSKYNLKNRIRVSLKNISSNIIQYCNHVAPINETMRGNKRSTHRSQVGISGDIHHLTGVVGLGRNLN